MRAAALLIGLFFGLHAAVAQPPDKAPLPPPSVDKARPPAPAGPTEFDVAFADGGKIKAVLLDADIAVTTKYGKLTVPVADVRKVVLGARSGADAGTDTVEAAEFTVRGRVETPALRVRTKQFGEATVKLAEIRQFQVVPAVAAGELSLDAARYGKRDWSAWLDTGVDVAAGGPLRVTCTGTITTRPDDAGRYTSTPGGNSQPAPASPYPLRYLDLSPGQSPLARGLPPFVTCGQVIGRLGKEGQPFVVGASLTLTSSPEAGRLYLQIAPSHYRGVEDAGGYKVQIKAGD